MKTFKLHTFQKWLESEVALLIFYYSIDHYSTGLWNDLVIMKLETSNSLFQRPPSSIFMTMALRQSMLSSSESRFCGTLLKAPFRTGVTKMPAAWLVAGFSLGTALYERECWQGHVLCMQSPGEGMTQPWGALELPKGLLTTLQQCISAFPPVQPCSFTPLRCSSQVFPP